MQEIFRYFSRAGKLKVLNNIRGIGSYVGNIYTEDISFICSRTPAGLQELELEQPVHD